MTQFISMILRLDLRCMRRIRGFLFIFLAVFSFNACEKDDICVDGDTALLIIRFYDIADTTEFKAVPNLRILGLGQSAPINPDTDRTSIDSIGIPLRIGAPNTTFLLIKDSADDDDMEIGNIDTLTFDYNTVEDFTSRACGFVASYENLTQGLTTDSENWIQDITILNSQIKKQDSAHVKIFH